MNATLPERVDGLVARDVLTGGQRDAMFGLLSQYFEGVTRRQFEEDLDEKNWVIEIHKEGRLVGFSTVLACREEFEGNPLLAIYSGDTIVSPEAWGSPALARTWIASINLLRARFPGLPCYWLLLTSGFRTYRFLPVFWRRFFPRPDETTPPDHQRLLDHLARTRYGAQYDDAAGLVRFTRPQKLRGLFAQVPPGRVTNPHIAYFLRRNPRHDRGDELACLTEIAETNLTPAGARMVATGHP